MRGSPAYRSPAWKSVACVTDSLALNLHCTELLHSFYFAPPSYHLAMQLRSSMLAAACCAAGAIEAPFAGGSLFADVASASSFRLGVRFGGWAGDALASPSLDPERQPAPSSPVAWGNLAGLQTSFGALLVATDGSGGWALYDENNVTLVSSGGAPWQKPPQNNGLGPNVRRGHGHFGPNRCST